MIPPGENIKLTRQPFEKSRDRKVLIASLIVGLILAVAVAAVICFYGLNPPR